MRKAGLILTLLTGLSLSGSAQYLHKLEIDQLPEVTANAGNDTLLCNNHVIMLGGNPTASGGSGNYFYQWSPAQYLDNSTSSNPLCSPESTTTYLLTVTDGNGCSVHRFVRIQVDPCLGIGETPLEKTLIIYPNPASDYLTISGIDPYVTERVQIELINYLGKVIRRLGPEEIMNTASIQIPLDRLERGSYFIRIITEGYAIVKQVEIQ